MVILDVIPSHWWSTLLTTDLLSEASQGLLDRSHGGCELIDSDDLLIDALSL